MFSLKRVLLFVPLALLLGVGGYIGYIVWNESRLEAQGFEQVANGDAQFWLMQGPPNDRYIPVTASFEFDQPVDEALVLERLKTLASTYRMFQRNVTEFDGLPYWQQAAPDWQRNFKVLPADADIPAIVIATEAELSQPSPVGEGLPLFRAYLSHDRTRLVFVWHHVISDLEGMFNKLSLHLFANDGERTIYGYQVKGEGADSAAGAAGAAEAEPSSEAPVTSRSLFDAARPLGFTQTNYNVKRLVLPLEDHALAALGQQAGLPMSDIFSFITVRSVTLYHERVDGPVRADVLPVLTPLSLRTSSLAADEGNNRAIKRFPVVFPLESVEAMYQRLVSLPSTDSSYDAAGGAMKFARRIPFLDGPMRAAAMPDYISNYFPLADQPLAVGEAQLVRHDLRVPMVPYEKTKFAWSNYAGEVQLFLHMDPVLINEEAMVESFEEASAQVIEFLRQRAEAAPA